MPDLFALADAAPWLTLAIALLIGALIGAERETRVTRQERVRFGLRDFVITSAIGWTCGIVHEPWFTALVVIAMLTIIVIHGRYPADTTHGATHGATTELALLTVFALSYAVALPATSAVIPIAIALAIVVTLLLDAKTTVKRFFHSSITDVEFAATVRFLALVFIIWPLMPDVHVGPYGFFHPRGLWQAVLLVSGLSYVGYFLEKYAGPSLGARAAAILGGLVSTTVVTASLAGRVRKDSGGMTIAWQSATLANAMQFPRVAVIVSLFAGQVVPSLVAAALGAFVVGLVLSYVIGRYGEPVQADAVALSNPLQLAPALRFAAYLALVSLGSSWAVSELGTQALILASALGSVLDVDAVLIAQAGLAQQGVVSMALLEVTAVVAVVANMMVKLGIAGVAGSFGFFWRLSISFAVMVLLFGGVLLLW